MTTLVKNIKKKNIKATSIITIGDHKPMFSDKDEYFMAIAREEADAYMKKFGSGEQPNTKFM